jgi:hypothetical protein
LTPLSQGQSKTIILELTSSTDATTVIGQGLGCNPAQILVIDYEVTPCRNDKRRLIRQAKEARTHIH